jgi:hypothetical protein
VSVKVVAASPASSPNPPTVTASPVRNDFFLPTTPLCLRRRCPEMPRHIKPILGRIMVVAVTTHAFPHRGVATRTVALAIFTYAFRKEFRADNPVRGVMRFADSWRERRLTDEECSGSALGTALENAAIEDSDRR